MKLLREYIKKLLEVDCPKPNRYGEGQYYDIDPQNPPTIKELLDCWVNSAAGVYENSMPVMFSPAALTPYREYKRGKLRNNIKGEYYQELKKSIAKTGIKEPLHLSFGKNGIAKIDEGNHRHEIAMELGLSKIPVILHFEREVKLTPHPDDRLKLPAKFRQSDQPKKLKRTRSPKEEIQLDQDVKDIIDILGL